MVNNISVEKAATSKIHNVDFENLAFGNTFTDHMLVCDYENGSWNTPKIVPYGPIALEPSSKIFHYGQSIFEGMKATRDEAGTPLLFRPEQHIYRLNASARRMCMPELPF